MARRLRLWLALQIAGPVPDLESRTQNLYEEIWPKHDHYRERTLASIRAALKEPR